MKSKNLYLSFLLLVLLVAACGGGDEDGGVAVQSANENLPTAADTPTLVDEASTDTPTEAVTPPAADLLRGLALPEEDADALVPLELAGGLLLNVFGNLGYFSFDGSEASYFSDQVDPINIVLSPAGDRVAFVGSTEAIPDDHVMIVDLGDPSAVLHVPELSPFLMGWSPDGLYVAGASFATNSWPRAVVVNSADGSVNQSEILLGGLSFAWTEGNTALIGGSDGAYQYEPATDELRQFPTTFDIEDSAATFFGPQLGNVEPFFYFLQEDLAAQGERIAGTNEVLGDAYTGSGDEIIYIRFPEDPSDLRFCDSFALQRAGAAEAFITFDATHMLSDPTLLPNGDILLIRWYRENCNIRDVLRPALLRVSPDGSAVETITEDLYYDEATVSWYFDLIERYTVSPDGEFVFYIARDGNSNTAIWAHHLNSGNRAQIMSRSSFRGRDALTYIAYANPNAAAPSE